MWILLIIIIALGWFLLWYIFAKLYFLTSIRRHRTDAIIKSKSVVRGHNIEKTAPLLPWFQYKMRDMTFVGKGIDYIIFDGLSSGNLKEVVFLEIKSGSSNQNNNEKMIEDIIKKGKVRYEVMRK
jgi:predicted Holliday junction resolvase-like endonuclease